jgi:hypothetical protein
MIHMMIIISCVLCTQGIRLKRQLQVCLMIEKYFQESSQFIKQTIKIYAKWTRLVISTGISWNKTEALSCLKLFMTQKIYLKVK